MNLNELHIDFASNANNYRRIHGGGRSQPIARAIGVKTYGLPLYVVDATAGLGQDAFVLATLGCRVALIERNPVLANLLSNAIEIGKENTEISAIIARMQLYIGNSLILLESFASSKPDIVYLDPMFPKRNKSALVKKDMQIMQEIIGDDNDAGQLLAIAQKVATRRVVVKRPKIAPYLNDVAPHSSQIGSANRFDIYMPN